MRTHLFPKMTLAWLVLACTITVPSVAYSYEESISVRRIQNDTLYVRSQNHSYTELLAARDSIIYASIRINPGRNSTVSNFLVTYELKDRPYRPSASTARFDNTTSDGWHLEEQGSWEEGDRNAQFKSSINHNIQLRISRRDLAPYAIAICEENAAITLENLGSLENVFSRDRTYPLDIKFNVSWRDQNETLHRFEEEITSDEIIIVCEANTRPTPRTGERASADELYIRKATIQANPVTQPNGTCALATQVAISTNQPNHEIKYQINYLHLQAYGPYRYTREFTLVTDRHGKAIASYRLPITNTSSRIESGELSIKGRSFKSNPIPFSMECLSQDSRDSTPGAEHKNLDMKKKFDLQHNKFPSKLPSAAGSRLQHKQSPSRLPAIKPVTPGASARQKQFTNSKPTVEPITKPVAKKMGPKTEIQPNPLTKELLKIKPANLKLRK